MIEIDDLRALRERSTEVTPVVLRPIGELDQGEVRPLPQHRRYLLAERARRLGMKTVAEGVEDQADWDFVRAAGCDLAQGYFIAKPMPGRIWPAGWRIGTCIAEYRKDKHDESKRENRGPAICP